MISADDAAGTMLRAVTDGDTCLRYLVGEDTRGVVQAWDTLPNEEYVRVMRRQCSIRIERWRRDRRDAVAMDQRISLVTLGVADVHRANGFYEALGWSGESPDGDVVFFQAGA